jgi:hypothetical protein
VKRANGTLRDPDWPAEESAPDSALSRDCSSTVTFPIYRRNRRQGLDVVGVEKVFDALVVDGLAVVEAFGVAGEEDFDAVAGALGDLRRIGACREPGGQGGVAQVVGTFT